jgi:hypothetical protein
MRSHPKDDGFSVVELVIACALLMVVFGAVFQLLNPAQSETATQPDAADMAERSRVSSQTLFRDLSAAGAGVDLGSATGPLVDYFPPVVPRRLGLQSPDAPFTAREDAITLVTAPRSALQSTLAQAFAAPTDNFKVAALPSCPSGQPLCGFAAGTGFVMFDVLGHVDFFTVTQVLADVAQVRLRGLSMSGAFDVGAVVAAADVHTYYFDVTNHQLRHYDGYLTDTPVVDNVVALSFEYFGDPHPPTRPKPPTGLENCLYDTTGTAKPMETIGPGQSLVPLPLSMLRDGPWCGAGTNVFDADLLRIKLIRVNLRVQATPASLRATGPLFASPGTSRSAWRYVPDMAVAFDVAPPNLVLR